MVDDAVPASRIWASEHAERAAIAGVGAVAFVAGLIRLTGPAFTPDESVTVQTAKGSIGDIWHAARTTEAPHFVYYLLMKPWIALVGSSEWLIRFPSTVFGALTALVLTALGIRLVGVRAGVAAGLALATSYYVVHWWQWARAYSLALLFATFATYAFVRAMEERSSRWTAIWVVTAVAACWINLFSISILAAHAIALATRRPARTRRLAVALGVATAAVVPIVALVATANNGQLDWIPSPTLHRVVFQSWDWAGRNPFALVAGAIGVVALVRVAPSSERWKAWFVVTWLVTPFVLTLALSAIQPAFDAHYLATAAPALALLVGTAVAALPTRLALSLGALVAAGALLQLVHFYVVPGQSFWALF
jgi:mannosyltransferase